MKPNNTVEDMWLRNQTENQKQKQNAQTQYADGMQILFVLYMAQLEPMFQQ